MTFVEGVHFRSHIFNTKTVSLSFPDRNDSILCRTTVIPLSYQIRNKFEYNSIQIRYKFVAVRICIEFVSNYIRICFEFDMTVV